MTEDLIVSGLRAALDKYQASIGEVATASEEIQKAMEAGDYTHIGQKTKIASAVCFQATRDLATLAVLMGLAGDYVTAVYSKGTDLGPADA